MISRQIVVIVASTVMAGCATVDPSIPLTFDQATVGTEAQSKPQTLYLPKESGRRPAMVILGKCFLSADTYEVDWGKRLASWGYVALVVDSLKPRGLRATCSNRGDISAVTRIPTTTRLADLVAASNYLRGRADVDPTRIGALGIDIGAVVLVQAAQREVADRARLEPLKAVVASSPICDPGTEATHIGGGGGDGAKLASDMLIMIGEHDDFDPGAAACRHFAESIDRNGHVLRLKIYPGAVHLFDTSIHVHLSSDGYTIGRNDGAALQSVDDVREFLNASLAR